MKVPKSFINGSPIHPEPLNWTAKERGSRSGFVALGSEFGIPGLRRFSRITWNGMGKKMREHVQESVEIHIISKGKHGFEVEGQPHHLAAGDVLTVLPAERHGDLTPPHRLTLYLLNFFLDSQSNNLFGFTGPDLDIIRERVYAPSFRKFRVDPLKLWDLELAYQILMGEHPLRRLEVSRLLFNFLLNLIYQAGTPTQISISPEIQLATETISREVYHAISVQKLAQDSGLSQRQFFTKFKIETGMSPKEYILNEKIKVAKKILKSSSMKICDIAYNLSFSSERHFATTFKLLAGQSASLFRKEKPLDKEGI